MSRKNQKKTIYNCPHFILKNHKKYGSPKKFFLLKIQTFFWAEFGSKFSFNWVSYNVDFWRFPLNGLKPKNGSDIFKVFAAKKYALKFFKEFNALNVNSSSNLPSMPNIAVSPKLSLQEDSNPFHLNSNDDGRLNDALLTSIFKNAIFFLF